MSLRDDILSGVLQNTRPLLANLGFRTNSLSLVIRTWSGGKPGASGATATDSDAVDIYPIPRIRAVSQRDIAGSGGRYQDGDLRADRLSPKNAAGGYDVTDLRPIVSTGQEIIYKITGPNEGEYELVDIETAQNFQYVLILRRRRITPMKGAS